MIQVQDPTARRLGFTITPLTLSTKPFAVRRQGHLHSPAATEEEAQGLAAKAAREALAVAVDTVSAAAGHAAMLEEIGVAEAGAAGYRVEDGENGWSVLLGSQMLGLFRAQHDAWDLALRDLRRRVSDARDLLASVARDVPSTIEPPALESSGWSYDVQTAEITDANGLKVARDVVAEDAPLIVFAPRLRKAALALVNTSPDDAGFGQASDDLEEILDLIAAHEQQSVPRAQGARLPATVTPALALLAYEAVDYQNAAFEDDSEVDGGDLVEWFADWRPRLEAALAGSGPIRIGVTLEGGLLQDVFSDRLLPGVEVVVIDYDTDGSDEAVEVEQIDAKDKTTGWADACVSTYEGAELTVQRWPAIRDADDEEEEIGG